MRILIDECLDWRLCRSLPGHDCSSVEKMGWSGLANGALLEKAEKEFDVFLTGDRNLTFQQSLTRFDLGVIILRADGIQLHQTLPLMPKVLVVLLGLVPGQIVEIAL
jgi:predicted nuclease of predicted toxin-antitoxin system